MNNNLNNLDPQNFDFWLPPTDHVVIVGPDQTRVKVPNVPLPIKIKNISENELPSDNAIGEGLYDYLRQFPDCLNNQDYAELLQLAYPHFLADMAAQVVMLDKKDVEPAYLLRKLTYLKILRLLNPKNTTDFVAFGASFSTLLCVIVLYSCILIWLIGLIIVLIFKIKR